MDRGDNVTLLRLLRVKQWIKNFFVFGALIFSFRFTDANSIFRSVIAFILFCMISSSVYIMNDISDIEKDRAHPRKKFRPIASGEISVGKAKLIMFLLIGITLVSSLLINKYVTLMLVIYFFNNILYSHHIKKIVILDVMSIALGFILRVLTGGIAIGVALSPWIVLCTLFISLFLGFEKRSAEIKAMGAESNTSRASLEHYTVEMLDQFITISSACTIVFYALYTTLVHPDKPMYITNLFVIYGMFRYKYLVSVKGEGESPSDAVMRDISIIAAVALWTVSCILIFILF